MNSTEEKQNGRLPEEASSSQQLTNSDSNANLTNQTNGTNASKGAIPKTKPAVKIKTSSKKSIKLNNNIEDVPVLSCHVQHDMVKLNGLSNGVSLGPYYNSVEPDFDDSSMLIRSNSYLSERDPEHRLSPIKCDIEPINFLSIQPCCSSSSVAAKANASSSDEDELLSLSDDGCIYTYKGDQVADLPTSFFSLDMPLIESPNPSNFSPEMDFLEMDFDPGPSGEADSDSISNCDIENTENLPVDEKRDDIIEKPAVKVEPSKIVTRNEDRDAKTDVSQPGSSNSKSKSLDVPKAQNELKIVKTCYKRTSSNYALSERTVATPTNAHTTRYHCKRGETLSPGESTQQKPVGDSSTSGSLYYKIVGSDWFDPIDTRDAIMIWTEQEAYLKQVSQIGPSECGATSVLNALNALKFSSSLERINECITTRQRANTSPLTEYLLSRSVAGTTHADIIDCLDKVSGGKLYSRFFPMYPERMFHLDFWLGFWIKNGAVPIATLNLQKCVAGPIPDAWHHQMIYGVGPKGVYLTNPIECVETEILWPQLCSEPVLLVRRDDVLSRWNIKTDLVSLMRINDSRWRRMNVVGQVAHVVYESRRELRKDFTNKSHIRIPAAYTSGVTLTIPVNSPACSLLREGPDLPLL